MTKKHFIALADAIKEHAKHAAIFQGGRMAWQQEQLDCLADFCKAQNPQFNRERWLGYIKGGNGPNGGAVKKARTEP